MLGHRPLGSPFGWLLEAPGGPKAFQDLPAHCHSRARPRSGSVTPSPSLVMPGPLGIGRASTIVSAVVESWLLPCCFGCCGWGKGPRLDAGTGPDGGSGGGRSSRHPSVGTGSSGGRWESARNPSDPGQGHLKSGWAIRSLVYITALFEWWHQHYESLSI